VKDTGATGYFAVHGDYQLNYPLLLSNNTTFGWQNKDGVATEVLRLDAYNNLIIHNPGASIGFWNSKESSPIGLINDFGVGIGPATIDTGGNARFNSLTLPNSAQPASAKPVSETQGLNPIAGESKPGVNFGRIIQFGNIPTNACKESEIPGVTAGADTFLVPTWPALESGLTGMMYVVDSGKIRVRVCNVTTNAINVAAHQFGGRFIH
jgi:hypothetical protein